MLCGGQGVIEEGRVYFAQSQALAEGLSPIEVAKRRVAAAKRYKYQVPGLYENDVKFLADNGIDVDSIPADYGA
jgi:hypothetical protein